MMVNTTSIHKRFTYKLSRTNLLMRLKTYGFIECGNVINFLKYVCDDELLGIPALRYIHSKIRECLKKHTSDIERFGNVDCLCYFQDLKVLKDELEFVISLSHE